MVEMGLADDRALSTHNYETTAPAPQPLRPAKAPPVLGQLGQRKLALT